MPAKGTTAPAAKTAPQAKKAPAKVAKKDKPPSSRNVKRTQRKKTWLATAAPVHTKGKSTTFPAKTLKKLAAHRSTQKLLAKIKAQAKAKKVAPESLIQRSSRFLTKTVTGENNGKTRRVTKGKKPRAYYPTEDQPKKKVGRHSFQKQVKKFKAGIEPGRVVIILAGRHRGKRVVVLKKLPSGLMLVTGPWLLNQCPLRRMHQRYVIVTSTKIDVSDMKLPEKFNDQYFKRPIVQPKKASDGSNIYPKRSKRFRPSEERKKDQFEVDKMVVKAICKSGQDRTMLKAYLGSYFKLRKGVFPHKLKF